MPTAPTDSPKPNHQGREMAVFGLKDRKITEASFVPSDIAKDHAFSGKLIAAYGFQDCPASRSKAFRRAAGSRRDSTRRSRFDKLRACQP